MNSSGLIVHADDFGETEQITMGICECLDAGVVSSTSIMANMPATDYALGLVPQYASRVSFGVHLTLCEGRPLTAARSLMDADGKFVSKKQLFLRSVTGRLDVAEVEAEISAQIGRVAAGGVRVSHLDGHKHLHQLPVVCSGLARAARRHGIERVRLSATHGMAALRSPSTAAREVLAVHAGRVFRDAGLRFPRRLVDIGAWMSQPDHPDRWKPAVEDAGIVEVFCHPGTSRADEEKPGSLDRSAELEFLLSEPVRAHLNRVRLMNYWSV